MLENYCELIVDLKGIYALLINNILISSYIWEKMDAL